MTTDQDFPGKVTHFKHFFFISIAQWSVEEDVTITSKVAKGKGKTRGKNGKSAKWAEEQDNKSTYSFKTTIRGNYWCFCIKYLHKEKETSFQHHVRQILVWQRLLCSKSGSQREAPLVQVAFTKEYFSLPDRVVPFLSSLGLVFFLFFSEDFLTLLIFPRAKVFHKQRASSREFCKVRDENKIWK